MAEVTFIGGGNNGFQTSDVQILPANAAQSAEVQLVGSAPAPGEVSTLVEILADEIPVDPPVVDFYVEPPFEPFSLNPNDNDLLYIVVGGLTSGAQGINVQVVRAPVIEGTGFAEQGYISDELSLFAGPLGPSGLIGKDVIFLQPTGVSSPSPIRGMTGTIAIILDVPTGYVGNAPVTVPPTDAELANGGVAIAFSAPLPIQPTNGDRFIIPGDDRILRRTPVIEVILE
jgi:hypothetical protein